MSNSRKVDFERLTRFFKALSNPHRLAIYQRLCTCCPPGTACKGEDSSIPCVSDLGKDLGIAPSTLSHHLKELRDAKLIEMTRNGKIIECSVEPIALSDIADYFAELAETDLQT